MPNYYWYLLLVIIFLPLFIFTLWQKREPKILALYLFMSGLTYLLEFVVLVLFQGYVYYPHVLKAPYFDNILGSVVSNAITIPITVSLIAVYNFNIFINVLIVVAIIGIELLFVSKGVYEEFWWRWQYTAATLILAILIAKKWFNLLKNNLNLYVRVISLYLVNIVLHASYVFIACAFFGAYFYSVGWFADPLRGHIAFATVYILIRSLIFSLVITFRLKIIWIIFTLMCLSSIDFMLLKSGILNMSVHWSLSYFLIARFIILVILRLIDKYLLYPSRSLPYVKKI